MTTDKVGLYVHIPFCVQKCNYCDFCSFSRKDEHARREYIQSLISEILSYKGEAITVDTVFFGGGTPSLLSRNEFSCVADAIHEAFTITPDAEFSVEANPKTLTKEKLECYTSHGVNRISIGLQSIHENEMKMLGRIHNFADFLESYRLVRDSGITNVNVDLMYGIPEQTMDSFAATFERVISLEPEHISLYGLIIEEGTPFYENRALLKLPSEDEECDMYYMAAKHLCRAGFSHYEISNYAKDGYRCKHNLKYWRGERYIGVGVSAHSCYDNKRFCHTDNIDQYLDDVNKKYDVTPLTPDVLSYEYVMLGMRLKEGISLREYSIRFGQDFLNGRARTVDRLIRAGLMIRLGDRLSLTERGFYVSNSILTELL